MNYSENLLRIPGTFALALALASCSTMPKTSDRTGAEPGSLAGWQATKEDGGFSPFYAWKQAVPPDPGQILRSEALPGKLGLEQAGEANRFLYTSRDAVDGRPIVVSGALFLPRGPVPAGGWPLVAWAHGTTGIADVCAPSTYPRTPRDSKYLNGWLASGFAVVATDYQGLGTPGPHPYTNFRAHAYSVLDSIRAAQHGDRRLSGKAILLGHSQGAATVIAAAGYAPTYAPELDILGTVTTGAPNLIREAVEAGVPSRATGSQAGTAFVLMANEVIQSEGPSKSDELLTREGKEAVGLANSMCYFDLVDALTERGWTESNMLQPGALAKVFSHNLDYRAYPSLRLVRPLFVGIGTADRTTKADAAKALVKQFCDAGSTVEAHVYEGQDHSGTVNAALPDALAFAGKLLSGGEVAPHCEPSVQAVSPGT